MASHDSAIKAHRQNLVKREANRQYRTRLRGALRTIRAAIDSGDPTKMKDAARYKSRLAARVTKRTSASA
jgi:small subunit ribosomal protein S20